MLDWTVVAAANHHHDDGGTRRCHGDRSLVPMDIVVVWRGGSVSIMAARICNLTGRRWVASVVNGLFKEDHLSLSRPSCSYCPPCSPLVACTSVSPCHPAPHPLRAYVALLTIMLGMAFTRVWHPTTMRELRANPLWMYVVRIFTRSMEAGLPQGRGAANPFVCAQLCCGGVQAHTLPIPEESGVDDVSVGDHGWLLVWRPHEPAWLLVWSAGQYKFNEHNGGTWRCWTRSS
jgi:hypothetical protein